MYFEASFGPYKPYNWHNLSGNYFCPSCRNNSIRLLVSSECFFGKATQFLLPTCKATRLTNFFFFLLNLQSVPKKMKYYLILLGIDIILAAMLQISYAIVHCSYKNFINGAVWLGFFCCTFICCHSVYKDCVDESQERESNDIAYTTTIGPARSSHRSMRYQYKPPADVELSALRFIDVWGYPG